MGASTPHNPPSPSPTEGAKQPERVYVKLPPPGRVRRGRGGPSALDALLYAGLGLLTFLLCVTLPLSAGAILILLLFQPGTPKHGLVWLWISMFVIVQVIAVPTAIGIWREVHGWTRRGDYLR